MSLQKNVCVSGKLIVLKLGMFMSIVLLNQDLFGLIDGDQTSQI